MTLSRVHTPANAAGAAKLLLLNKRLVTQILSCTMLLYPQCWVTHLKPVSGLNRNPNPDHNVMQSRLPQKNLMVSSVVHVPPLHRILWKSVE